jgi:hypothetical protein
MLWAFSPLLSYGSTALGGKWAPGLNQLTVSVRRDVLAIYVSTGLIVLRNLLRFIEFASGPVSPATWQEYWYVS